MRYFAYGSNMLLDQMRGRCPSAAFVCIATLADYRLAFTRTAKGNWKGYGVADVVRATGEKVWGVVLQIDESDVAELDRSEGYQPSRAKNAYRRTQVQVLCDGDTSRPLEAQTYVVCEREVPDPLPHREYVARIVQGARHWNLPDDYLRRLEHIEVNT